MKKGKVIIFSVCLGVSLFWWGCSDITSSHSNNLLDQNLVNKDDGSDSSSQTADATKDIPSPSDVQVATNGNSTSTPSVPNDVNTTTSSIPSEVRVQFDPAYGTFYYSDRQPSSNPINITAYTGDVITSPQDSMSFRAIPYKEGCKFMGWVREYPYPDRVLEEKHFWDFEKDILMENIALYAYFEESDTPDTRPAVPVNSTPSSSSGSRLFDHPVQDVPPLSILTTTNSEGRYEFFATGVNQSHGWLNNVQYKNNCAATSASQMIYWYHERINELAQIKDNVGFSEEEKPIITDQKVLELRDYFGDWMQFSGAQIVWALEKYFTEKLDSHRMQDIVSYHCSNGIYFTLESLSKILLKHLSRGDMCGLTAVNFDGGLHAMNIYGAEFNEQGTVEVIYVTSSPTLETEEQIKNHKPRLYKFYRNGESYEGAAKWLATYESKELGYVTTSQTAIQNIYRLDFLTLEQYKE